MSLQYNKKTAVFYAALYIPFFVAIPLLVAEHGFLFGMKTVYYTAVIGVQFVVIAFSKKTNKQWHKKVCALLSIICIANSYIPLMVYIGYTDFMDVHMIKDAGWYSSWITLVATTGTLGVIFLGLGLWLLQKIFQNILQQFSYAIETKILKKIGYSSCVFCFVILVVTSSATAKMEEPQHAAAPVTQKNNQKKYAIGARNTIQPIQIPTEHFTTKSKENVIILQLESANAMLINGYGTDEVGPTTYQKYIPTMAKIAKENGVLFPMFWSNAIQTNRALSTILCGTVNNIHSALTNTIQKIPHKCLPEILKQSGYSTHFYSAHWVPTFQNTKNFAIASGFDYSHWSEYMPKETIQYSWGYNDCDFYTETAKKLRDEKSDKPVFAYIQVSANHTSFYGKEEYKDQWTAPHNKTIAEKTLNSIASQDYCLSKFVEEFSDTIANAHVFILSDHSFPNENISNHNTNQKGISADNFLVPFAYLPPESKKYSTYVGQVKDGRRFSHADILPTIFELLNGKMYSNSFAYALQKNEEDIIDTREIMYEPCHIFTQPYQDASLSVLRGNDKYNYRIDDGTVTKVQIIADMPEKKPKTIQVGISYQEFVDSYYCDRYKMFM